MHSPIPTTDQVKKSRPNRRHFSIDGIAMTAKEVTEELRRSRTWLYSRLSSDPSFPKPIDLGRPVWLREEIVAWLKTQPRKVEA